MFYNSCKILQTDMKFIYKFFSQHLHQGVEYDVLYCSINAKGKKLNTMC